MALAYRTISKNCNSIHSISKLVKWSTGRHDTVRIMSSAIFCQNDYYQRPLFESKQTSLFPYVLRQCTTQSPKDKTPEENANKKEGIIQRLKQMYKDYWYVVLPVHMATSCIWFGCFYYTVRSGVDVIGILQAVGISESIVSPLRDSSAGYVALTFALYKLVTPLRYAVTVGGTTYAIKKLTTIGWIKPVPSRERLKEIYQEKKDNFKDAINESKQHYNTLKEKRIQVMEDMKRYKTEMRNMKMKDKVKKM